MIIGSVDFHCSRSASFKNSFFKRHFWNSIKFMSYQNTDWPWLWTKHSWMTGNVISYVSPKVWVLPLHRQWWGQQSTSRSCVHTPTCRSPSCRKGSDHWQPGCTLGSLHTSCSSCKGRTYDQKLVAINVASKVQYLVVVSNPIPI